MTDLRISCQIFPDLHISQWILRDIVRSFQIFTYSNRPYNILTDLDRSWQILTILSRPWQILTYLSRSWQIFTYCNRSWKILTGLDRYWHIAQLVKRVNRDKKCEKRFLEAQYEYQKFLSLTCLIVWNVQIHKLVGREDMVCRRCAQTKTTWISLVEKRYRDTINLVDFQTMLYYNQSV